MNYWTQLVIACSRHWRPRSAEAQLNLVTRYPRNSTDVWNPYLKNSFPSLSAMDNPSARLWTSFMYSPLIKTSQYKTTIEVKLDINDTYLLFTCVQLFINVNFGNVKWFPAWWVEAQNRYVDQSQLVEQNYVTCLQWPILMIVKCWTFR